MKESFFPSSSWKIVSLENFDIKYRRREYWGTFAMARFELHNKSI